MKLHSLNDIFERRLLRIPDYQRGYAWVESQLEAFWDDIMQLDINRVHYTGVITLEPVSKKIWSHWSNDEWLIEDVGFTPYYVVDGQQRLTTSMVLLQAIFESVPADTQLNYQSVENLRKRFILFKADNGIQESYIFGYEKDNPSDEYLRTRIFGMHSPSDLHQETLYTYNLNTAKKYFLEKLSQLQLDEIAVIYKKLTQKLKFNLYEIDDEIDVFVTFETMNNRGKPLTSLELLKNRLIYLSTLFTDNPGREKLRSNINDAWKTMYEYLGKNPEHPLSDNSFLRNHWTMYFKYSRRKGDDYIKYLLDEKFTARNITNPKNETEKLSIEEISEYVKSLQQSIVFWFYIHNPFYPETHTQNEQNRICLDRLWRLSFRSFRPLILAAFVSKQKIEDINLLLNAAERYNFALFNLSQRRSNTGDSEFFGMARELLFSKIAMPDVINVINRWVDYYYDPDKFFQHIEDIYKIERDGFYHWDGLRYVLYEHEQHLREKGKNATNKLSWATLNTHKSDHVTVEHVFPQTPSDPYWVKHFGHFDAHQQRLLTHSLGNLLPLSRSKNSSLQNISFDLKKNNGNGVGYYNGSVSENEIALSPDWTAKTIVKRGLDLLEFIENRWDLKLGDDTFKLKLLKADFTTSVE